MSGGFSQGFTDNQKPSSKVLRPPGGGCSDIFGSDSQATPRTVRNHMSSNIFGSTQNSPVKNSGDNSRRMGKDGDSYNRLFGNTDRPFTPAKNHMKSNIPLGGEPVKTANGNAPTNGHSNGKAENNNAAGQQNGVSKTEIEASPKDPGSGDSNQAQSTQNQEATSKNPSDGSNNNACNIDNNSSANENPQSNIKEQSEFTPNDSGASENSDNLSITANANINVTDNVDGANVASSKHTNEASLINGTANGDGSNIEKGNKDEDRSSTTNSSIASPMSGVSSDSIDASNKSTISSGSSLRSPRAGSRNPVTGFGIEMPSYKRNRVLRRDGNPVTGEGYNGAGGSEVNTTVPSLNGAKQVINKNRIPPGGYSSGLW